MKAIEIIQESIKIHEEWLAFFLKYPDEEKKEEYKHLGNRFFHGKCIDNYKKAIKQIEQLQAKNKNLLKAFGLARSMVLSGEDMTPQAEKIFQQAPESKAKE